MLNPTKYIILLHVYLLTVLKAVFTFLWTKSAVSEIRQNRLFQRSDQIGCFTDKTKSAVSEIRFKIVAALFILCEYLSKGIPSWGRDILRPAVYVWNLNIHRLSMLVFLPPISFIKI